ncbi:MAG: AAA family ATPase [Acetobacteraceae bacterium]|nr:AAA family ATPase [Acetobacteraceae bacterium]
MPVRFARLRIAGFKSFAEPATVEIRPGLTGIVGPNGCGKSNVVEALRWAMGESSAKSLRGGEMDDVIFAGTTSRPSRNIAEVVLLLDETAGAAPPPFHQQAELEISRRIERGEGSTYRVNGREVRARDVQTLFADLASGAHSSAMVSQGRVGAIVNARPESRRMILEEAAGITGLHARRHEAEVKLRGAEANLSRAEDLRAQLEAQLAALKRQARQASRYRNISGAIRAADAELFAIQRARVEAARAAARLAWADAQRAVAEATGAAASAAETAAREAETLPPLRNAEADARTALERHRVAREQIAAEEGRARAALAAASERLAQLRHDLAHAEQLSRDAGAAEVRLATEDAALAEADTGHEARLLAADAAAAEAADRVREAEADANRATEAAAEANAQTQAASQALTEAENRARRLADQALRTGEERARVAAVAIDAARLDAAAAAQSAAEAVLAETRTALAVAEAARAQAVQALAAARERQSAEEGARAKLAAETQALAEVLGVKDGERWPPMVDALGVPPGLEAALGAALGEELTSAADRGAARHWRELPGFDPAPPLPGGAAPLASTVEGPPALHRALSQIGLVETDAEGDAGQGTLAPGQTLVSRAGGVWRWDGYTVRAGAPTAAAIRLQQRNRWAGLRTLLAAAEIEAASAREARAEAEALERAATAAEGNARTARRDAEQRLERSRTAYAQLRAQAATVAARLSGLDEQTARIEGEAREAETALARARDTRAALPDVAALRAEVDRTRTALATSRNAETAARAGRETTTREHEARSRRRRAIDAERGDWRKRADDAAGRVADLTGRRDAAMLEAARLETAPAAIAARKAEASETLAAAEGAHRRRAALLADAVGKAERAQRADREAQAAAAAARESAVRAEGRAGQADAAWGVVAERILERLGASPDLPVLQTEPGPETEEKARRKLDRLAKERDEMGPVNLRAELEAGEVETQIDAIAREREELASAIAKLRGSIGHLNREGRERLATVFQDVDRHFQLLFARMFGGGRAHLALVGSDDPLEAGLEIYAQPPGKKLATLSLLSGGEQALTALSLIFALFRCNPAPVCVLDEVDAPLDDANVERFCNLLEDMVAETDTRFLVVTHHHLTMARMDRLYGVTMQERGISRLLSVDLQVAAALVEQPRMAAE